MDSLPSAVALREMLKNEKGFSDEQLAALVQKKQEEFAGLLHEQAALFAIARENGLRVERADVEVNFARIADLKEGEEANLLCRVKRVYAMKKFMREEKEGKVINVTLEDGSGEISLVLWNFDAEKVAKGSLEKGDVLEVYNGLVKKGIDGLEVQLGLAGMMRRSEKQLPGSKHELVKIAGLREGEYDVVARVLELGGKAEFERSGRKGQFGDALVGDESGTVRLVLWDENADVLDKLHVNDVVKIENGFVKTRNGKFELHVGRGGRLLVNPRRGVVADRAALLKTALLQIDSLTRDEIAEVKVQLVAVLEVKDVGEKRILKVKIKDGSGEVDALLYNDNALKFFGLKNLAPDISLATVWKLKEKWLAGHEFFLVGKLLEEDGGKEFLVERVIG